MKASFEDFLGCHNIIWNKPWFDQKSCKLVEQRKNTKMQWLQACHFKTKNQSNFEI